MKVTSIAVFQENAIPVFRIKARHLARLRETYPEARVVWCRNEASFLRVLPQTQVALTWAFRQAWFDRAPALRRIATPAAGRDFFPITPPSRVKVRHGTYHGTMMGETVLGLMLAFERGLYIAYRHQLQGELWPREALYDVRLLRGSHAVIVGFGHVADAIGRLLKPFGVRVTGIRRSPSTQRPDWFGKEDAVWPVSRLDDVLPSADHLILVLPSDTGTDRMFDARRLSRLPKHAVVYNVGRGNCVDERALARALRAGALRGACLDVFEKEPLTADSPLAEDLPGLIRLPHASAYSERYMDLFLDEVVAWLKR